MKKINYKYKIFERWFAIKYGYWFKNGMKHNPTVAAQKTINFYRNILPHLAVSS